MTPVFHLRRACLTLLLTVGVAGMILTGRPDGALALGWTDVKIRLLPDEAFAVVEEKEGGIKVRHCPYRDRNGRIETEQLIYVLGTLDEETWVDPKNEAVARRELESHYNRFIESVRKRGIDEPININEAPLSRLVALPNIGPVMAVKIVRYRDRHGRFMTPEAIQKVSGIGPGTYNGIRFVIRVD
jgi:competence ComEA-like helix-hairpin-helix protein